MARIGRDREEAGHAMSIDDVYGAGLRAALTGFLVEADLGAEF